ncbi:hypothetical protein [Polycladidibacter hongkongensis]|uniref:hypothetical protein n=1 Tax=Polycladidibacter hongkongensis TaxID=1647556 RepID=UPI00082E5687|nr:hypothetical protein [Pseudovibrio hongkongensis]
MLGRFLGLIFSNLRGRSSSAWALLFLMQLASLLVAQYPLNPDLLPKWGYWPAQIAYYLLMFYTIGYWLEEMNGLQSPGSQVLARYVSYTWLSIKIVAFFVLCVAPVVAVYLLNVEFFVSVPFVIVGVAGLTYLFLVLWCMGRMVPAYAFLARSGSGGIKQAWAFTRPIRKHLWVYALFTLVFFSINGLLGFYAFRISGGYVIALLLGLIGAAASYAAMQAVWQLASEHQESSEPLANEA